MPSTRTPQRRTVPTVPTTPPPAREIEALRNRIRHFFDAPLGRFMQEPFFESDVMASVGWLPAVEVTESDAEYIVTAELPGMTQDDVRVEFENGVLTVAGEKRSERKEERDDNRQLVWERSYGRFERSLGFPAVDDARITAEMKDGVMTVKLPKMVEAKPKGRRINVANGK